MPTEAEHLNQANRNGRVVDLIHKDGNSLEWAAAVLFYQALHLVNAFFRRKLNVEPGDHRERQVFVQRFLKRVSPDYDELYTSGREARYACTRFTDADITDLREQVGKIAREIERLR